MTEEEVRNKLRTWIVDRSRLDTSTPFADDTQIIDSGFLTSLDIVELILFIESLLDDEVDIDALEPESFENINSLIDTFFAEKIAL